MSRATRMYIAFFACLALGVPGCSQEDSGPDKTIPEAIRGVWATDDPEYADQRLELMEGAVLFYTEERAFDPYIVRGIQTVAEEGGTAYEIAHSGWDGGEMILSLFVRTGDTTLVFKNQPFRVWRWVAVNR